MKNSPAIRAALLAAVSMAAILIPVERGFSAPDDSLSLGQHQFQTGAYSAAIATLTSILSHSQNSAAANYWLGRCYYELRDYDRAIAHAEQSTQLDPNNSVYHDWLGRAYGGKADRDRSFFLARKTKKEFEEAVQLDKKNVVARRDLEEFYLQAPWMLGGSKDAALEQVNAIAAVDPMEGHLGRAVYWRDAKKLDQAEAEYAAVLQLKPNRVEPYFEVASFYADMGDAAKMEQAIAAAALVAENDQRLSYYRGVADVIAATRMSEAERYLKSYIASAPDRSDWPSHAAAREWLGQLYEKLGQRMEAAEQYRAALQLDPGMKSARERLAQLEKVQQ